MTTKAKNLDRAHKIAENANKDSRKVIEYTGKMINKFHESHFKDPQKSEETLKKTLKWGKNRINANRKGIHRAYKVAEAMDKRTYIKRGLKGAAIGAAVIAPFAYAANKSERKDNKKNEEK